MKAILLARVSSAEQEDTHSIPAQLERIQEYAQRNNLNVVEVFQITESSTKDTRKKFEKIIEAIKKSKEPIALVVETVDRLQRSFKESITLNDFVQEGKLAIHFLRENLVVHKDSNSSDHMRWDMAVMFAKSYVMQLSDNVKRSFQRKLKEGEWPREAPLGYINYRDEKDNSCIEPDPERAPLIKKIFELYASGNHSMITLVKECKKMGLTTKKGKTPAVSTIERMLKNPFYHGYMQWEKFYGPHKYERIITKELFDKCTAVREGWNKKPTQYSAKPFIFRGIIQCKLCGSTVTGEMKKKKYIYYHCGKRSCPQNNVYTKESTLLKEVEKVFKGLSKLPKEVIDEIVTGLKSACRASSDFHMDSLKALQAQYEKYENRKSALYDDKLDGSITADFYDKKFKEYTDKQADIQQQMQEHNKANNTVYITASLVLDLAKRSWEIFESSETREKRAFINFLLQNSNLNDKNLEFNLKEPFNTILQHSKLPRWQGLRDALGTFDWSKIALEVELIQKFLNQQQDINTATLPS